MEKNELKRNEKACHSVIAIQRFDKILMPVLSIASNAYPRSMNE